MREVLPYSAEPEKLLSDLGEGPSSSLWARLYLVLNRTTPEHAQWLVLLYPLFHGDRVPLSLRRPSSHLLCAWQTLRSMPEHLHTSGILQHPACGLWHPPCSPVGSHTDAATCLSALPPAQHSLTPKRCLTCPLCVPCRPKDGLAYTNYHDPLRLVWHPAWPSLDQAILMHPAAGSRSAQLGTAMCGLTQPACFLCSVNLDHSRAPRAGAVRAHRQGSGA